jgi:hypothetical protein
MKNFVFILALVLVSSVAIGQKVNYSGEWKLNEGKSTLGYEFSLAPASMTVTHTRKTLDIKLVNVFDGQEYVTEQHYTLDGEEVENLGFMESVTKSTAVVDKKSKDIKIDTKGSAEGMDYTLIQNFSLKEGNLVVQSEAASDMGELVETFVYDKQ